MKNGWLDVRKRGGKKIKEGTKEIYRARCHDPFATKEREKNIFHILLFSAYTQRQQPPLTRVKNRFLLRIWVMCRVWWGNINCNFCRVAFSLSLLKNKIRPFQFLRHSSERWHFIDFYFSLPSPTRLYRCIAPMVTQKWWTWHNRREKRVQKKPNAERR